MSFVDASSRLDPGTLIGRYRLGNWLATGGTADIYTCHIDSIMEPATTPENDRYVAKIFRFFGEEEEYERRWQLFSKEAEVLEQLSGNIHVITVFEKGFFQAKGENGAPRPFTIQQRLSGGSLADLVASDALSEDVAIRIAIGLTDALVYAHQRGYLHCDVKPDNVMLDESKNPVWIDFGISKEMAPNTSQMSLISSTGSVAVGTAPYMSPEHFMGRHSLCPQSDVWSMGVLIMRILTRLYPFGLHFEQVRQKATSQTWEAFRDLPVFAAGEPVPHLSPRVEAIVTKCLQVNLADRYQSAEELKIDLEAALKNRSLQYATAGGSNITEGPTGVTNVYNYNVPRKTAILAGSTAGLVIVILALAFAMILSDSPADDDYEVTAAEEIMIPPFSIISESEVGSNAPAEVAPPPDVVDEPLDTLEIVPEPPPPVALQDPETLFNDPMLEQVPVIEPELVEEIENYGTPVYVMLIPNSGYRSERVTVNGQQISPTVGLVQRFEGRIGQVFEWNIVGTDGESYTHEVLIPTEAAQSRTVRIDWRTGEIQIQT